jgi:hypothetical protein
MTIIKIDAITVAVPGTSLSAGLPSEPARSTTKKVPRASSCFDRPTRGGSGW